MINKYFFALTTLFVIPMAAICQVPQPVLETYINHLKQYPEISNDAQLIEDVDQFFLEINHQTNQEIPSCRFEFLNNQHCKIIEKLFTKSVFGIKALTTRMETPINSTQDTEWKKYQTLIAFFKNHPNFCAQTSELLGNFHAQIYSIPNNNIFNNNFFHEWIKFAQNPQTRLAKVYNSLSWLIYGASIVTQLTMTGCMAYSTASSAYSFLHSWLYPIKPVTFNPTFWQKAYSYASQRAPSLVSKLDQTYRVWRPQMPTPASPPSYREIIGSTAAYASFWTYVVSPILSVGGSIQENNTKRKVVNYTINSFLKSLSQLINQLQEILYHAHTQIGQDDLTLPATINPDKQGIMRISQALKTIGIIDACCTIATAINQGKFQQVTFSTNNIQTPLSKEALEQGLKTLWTHCGNNTQMPCKWNEQNYCVISAEEEDKEKTEFFVENLVLAQTLGIVECKPGQNAQQAPLSLPLINIDNVAILTKTMYMAHEKQETLIGIMIAPSTQTSHEHSPS